MYSVEAELKEQIQALLSFKFTLAESADTL